MRGAFAMTVCGLYAGSLYLASHNPVFYDLAILLTGIILGIAFHDCILRFPREEERTLDSREGINLEEVFNKNPEKTRNAMKLKQMLERKIWNHSPPVWFYSNEAKDCIKELGPEVLDLNDDALWGLINEGEDYAFRNPTDAGRTIVMRKDFAEKALVLGCLPRA